MRTCAIVLLSLAACSTPPSFEATPGAIGFDGADALRGWHVESTGGAGPAATWQVRTDATAISRPAVLAMTAPNHGSDERFNLCWTDTIAFHHADLRVCMRADSGVTDRGGGPMWRVRDANNYYVCRYNPLESNFRLYVVKDGVRRQLATALVEANGDAWHRIEVHHVGTKIVCSFDGQALLTAEDATIGASGGVGLWTKADACTSFDDLSWSAAKS